VRTGRGDIRAAHVVLACGMWTRDLAATVGVRVPLHACEHFYIVTEPFDGVTPDLPVLRDYDHCAYYKEDAGKILLGAFEPEAKPWGMDGIPENFCFDQLPDDFDHFQPVLEAAVRRMPALETAGIQTFFCGPESFTPDNRYHLGPAPEVEGLFVAAGLNSIGIQSAGGIGKVVADWLRDGLPPADLTGVDIRRNMPFQSNARYLRERVSETLGLLYDVHWPFYQYRTARGARRSPLHERLQAAGACFGEAAGWERANWFANEGQAPVYDYSFGRQNWFGNSAAEHRAVREGVGLLDLSPFAKFRVTGPDAEAVLNRICANDVAVPPGRVVYTQWLNARGGIEADLTVTRLGETDYMVVTSAASQVRDLHWLRTNCPDDARAAMVDVTSAEAVIAIMGPRARDVLSAVTPADLSSGAFPFGTAQEIEIGYALVRAARVSYVGELGWELYVPTEFAVHVYDTVMAAGGAAGLRPVGMHAMESLRLEKAFRHWGHDISDEDTPLEAGLGFAVAWDKPGGFIGRDALLRQREAGPARRLLQFRVEDPEPLLYHNEPVWRDGAIAGYLTSGWYGHTLGGGIGLGYVDIPAGADMKEITAAAYEIEVAGIRYPAQASLQPLYDPKGERMRG
jgi:4-methylaminobutanoate oxidase (formaldehyde-forming)